MFSKEIREMLFVFLASPVLRGVYQFLCREYFLGFLVADFVCFLSYNFCEESHVLLNPLKMELSEMIGQSIGRSDPP